MDAHNNLLAMAIRTVPTIYPAVYLSGARVSISPTLVPRLRGN